MASFAAMVDMARTPEEVRKELGNEVAMPSPAVQRSVPTYPYGLTFSLDEDTLEKLGIDGDLPSVGDMIHFCGMAKVTSASASEREGTDGSKETCRRVELQITHLGLEDEDQEKPRNWYGDTMNGSAAEEAAEGE